MICIVTGANGGIGRGIARSLKEQGYFVLGIDMQTTRSEDTDEYLQVDLSKFSSDLNAQKVLVEKLRSIGLPVTALINNAALQYCTDLEGLSYESCTTSFEVNVFAPMFLAKCCESFFQSNSSVINILSIHDHLTKPDFLLYASTKGALTSFTKAMSVQYSDRFRIFGIRPAAIDTPMLRDGFADDPDGFDRLSSFHPAKTIGSVSEIANLVCYLISDGTSFTSGSIFDVCGGIQHRLHDPA